MIPSEFLILYYPIILELLELDYNSVVHLLPFIIPDAYMYCGTSDLIRPVLPRHQLTVLIFTKNIQLCI
ncbi:hypothetical protein C437_07787 [Haloarcula vallismortis ATCC 29715]|uniref:Uncharacterized protein n=1 Tax=Haloarcula vallismortis ATCC 29715 TaxID=662477 RepID=M0JIK8_HALVA|nr:hypothetical protein C437_07787 [Haloarcula vallismortis ATCC 29715]